MTQSANETRGHASLVIPSLESLQMDKMVEAAGIEPDPVYFEKRRRRAIFVVNSMKGKGFGSNLLSP